MDIVSIEFHRNVANMTIPLWSTMIYDAAFKYGHICHCSAKSYKWNQSYQ